MTKAIISTNKGDINLNLFEKDSPITVASFVFLARQGYYDGLNFHRVIDNFMIQGGCPSGTGRDGPRKKGISSFPFQGETISYPFTDEFKSGRVFDKPGQLAMANSGPHSNGSQFFITHIITDWLTNKHTIFGEVTSQQDQDVVNAIVQGDKITKITIV
ncbi:MAG: peptidylprolyl isomerase [Candidatus Lokiarchaeota archaeon]|nr:peptidylprolyl isomerase [Candidatus Lokiarchaeota archaeon]